MSRTITIIALVALFATGAFYVWREPPALDLGQLNVPESVSKPVTLVPSSVRENGGSGRLAISNGGWPDNLFAFAQDLKIRSAAGDSGATWLLTRIYDYCAGFAHDPQAYNSGTEALAGIIPADKFRLYRASRNRVAANCKGFAAADIPTNHQLLEMRVDAARQGNLAAQAAQLGSSSKDPTYAAKLTREILRANDPEALFALSEALPSSEAAVKAAFPTAASSLEANYAMQLLACKAGMDCSASGWLMTALCANGGMCSSYPDIGGMIHNDLLTPSAARRVDGLVRATTGS